MNRLIRFLVRLYPAMWRLRYKAEFGALLEDVDPTWRTALDVLEGGLTMQLKMFTGWKIVSLTALLGIIGGLVVSHETLDEYASSAVIKIQLAQSSKEASARTDAFVKRAVNDAMLAEIVERYHLYPELRAKDPLTSLAQMKKDIRIQPARVVESDQPNPQNAIMVRFRYYDGPLSQRVCSELVSRLMAPSRDPALNGLAPITLRLLDAPSLPNGPFYPNRVNLLITGLLAGIVIGLTIAFFRRTPKPA
jgi:hypothetical protein